MFMVLKIRKCIVPHTDLAWTAARVLLYVDNAKCQSTIAQQIVVIKNRFLISGRLTYDFLTSCCMLALIFV